MIKKRLIVLLSLYQAFGLPLTVNFQMVVKDGTGKPVVFDHENVTFSMSGDMGIGFWSETKPFTSPNGILNTRLGDVTSIDPVSFYAQNSVKLTVIRAGNDTILSEPFNTVPFAFKAGFSDSSRNAYSLQGKVPSDFLAASFEATIKTLISDSIAIHPAPNPAAQISDTAAEVRADFQNKLSDTASVLRGYTNSLQTGMRDEIHDSIAAHPGIDPTPSIKDSASAVRSYAVAQDNALRTTMRAEIQDSADVVRVNSRSWMGDTANVLRGQLRGNISDTAAVIKTRLRNEIRDSIAAHPGIDPTPSIRDSASAVRSYAVALDNALRTVLRDEIQDSAGVVRLNSRTWTGDTANILRTQLRGDIGDTAISIRNYTVTQDSTIKTAIRSEVHDSITKLLTTSQTFSNGLRINGALGINSNPISPFALFCDSTVHFKNLFLHTTADPGLWYPGNDGQLILGGSIFYLNAHFLVPGVAMGNVVFSKYAEENTYFHFRKTPEVGSANSFTSLMTIDNNGNIDAAGELKIKVYSQANIPTLSNDSFMAIWSDTDDSNRIYLVFRKSSGTYVKVEMN